MKFPHSYYEDSTRCDFFIPSMIKRTWAVGLEILSDIDEVCRKNNIEYFAEWGTLLGTVRHAGYIPWDDDLDICMKREDYNKFLSIAEDSLPDGYKIVNYKTSPDFKQMLSRVVNTDHYRFDNEYMSKFSGLPFAMGIDIFPLDYISDDEDYEQNRFEKLFLIQSTIDNIEKNNKKLSELSYDLTLIEENCNVKLIRSGNLPLQLRNLSEKLHGEVPLSKAKYITLYDLWFSNHDHKYPIEYYKHSIRMPFENTTIPVPLYYDSILKQKYGASYMTPIRKGGAHNYPYFQIHLDVLKEHFNYEWPHYSFTEDDILNNKNRSKFSFKQAVNEYVNRLLELHKSIFANETDSDFDNVLGVLTNCQTIAIELGTLIEQRYCEGTNTVSLLEEYCESLFEISSFFNNWDNVTNSNLNEKPTQLNNIVLSVFDTFNNELLHKKTVLFIESNIKNFHSMEALLHKYSQDDNTIVKIMPIPRYEIAIDMSGANTVFDYEDYPSQLPLIDFNQYDLSLHPDEIVIDWPYDDINLVNSVDKVYYARNLINYTDKLTLVPFFILDNVPEGDERSYINLKSYLSTPGIAVCDEIVVSNKSLKDCFVKLLNELTDDKYANIWSSKINIVESTNPIQLQSDSSRKTLLYYVGINSFLEHKERMIEKVESSFKQFIKSSDFLDVIFVLQNDLIDSLEKYNSSLKNDFVNIYEKYTCETNITKCAPADSNVSLASRCDAYYGEASFLVPAFTLLHKPVMLHNPEV